MSCSSFSLDSFAEEYIAEKEEEKKQKQQKKQEKQEEGKEGDQMDEGGEEQKGEEEKEEEPKEEKKEEKKKKRNKKAFIHFSEQQTNQIFARGNTVHQESTQQLLSETDSKRIFRNLFSGLKENCNINFLKKLIEVVCEKNYYNVLESIPSSINFLLSTDCFPSSFLSNSFEKSDYKSLFFIFSKVSLFDTHFFSFFFRHLSSKRNDPLLSTFVTSILEESEGDLAIKEIASISRQFKEYPYFFM